MKIRGKITKRTKGGYLVHILNKRNSVNYNIFQELCSLLKSQFSQINVSFIGRHPKVFAMIIHGFVPLNEVFIGDLFFEPTTSGLEWTISNLQLV